MLARVLQPQVLQWRALFAVKQMLDVKAAGAGTGVVQQKPVLGFHIGLYVADKPHALVKLNLVEVDICNRDLLAQVCAQ